MIRYKKFISRFVASLILIGFISSNSAFAQGEALFKAQCANCHKIDGDYTGPWLKGVRDRQPSKEYIYEWMANPAGKIATDAYAKALFAIAINQISHNRAFNEGHVYADLVRAACVNGQFRQNAPFEEIGINYLILG